MAVIEKVYKYDSIISYRFGDLRSRQWLKTVMILASKLGDGPGWVIVSLFVLAFGGEAGRRAVILVVMAFPLCVAVFKIIKSKTSRQRPFEKYPDLVMESALPPPDRFSFPSGHSMCAFAIATIISFYFPVASIPLCAFAALIAASRIFLALHYPTDCLAGAAVGVMISLALITALG
ncbi:MAG: phosphatase PAP2 family protein [Deltaproteobacteria bacterium]|nr:phosphatase PAP2 family protein [Deltaproteobacteria bacterium]